MRFKVKKPIKPKGAKAVIPPGRTWDDDGRLTAYEIDLLKAMGVLEPLDVVKKEEE